MDDVLGPVEPSSGVRRRVSLRTRRRVLVVLAAIAAGVTLGPLPISLLDAAHAIARTIGSWLPGDTEGRPRRNETEAMLNILVPAVLVPAVGAAYPRVRAHRLLLGAVVASLCVEAVQLVIPGRQSHIRDIVLNSAGAVVGTVTVIVARRLFRAQS